MENEQGVQPSILAGLGFNEVIITSSSAYNEEKRKRGRPRRIVQKDGVKTHKISNKPTSVLITGKQKATIIETYRMLSIGTMTEKITAVAKKVGIPYSQCHTIISKDLT